MKLTIDDVRSRFIKHFDGETGSVYASPGRINLIDYYNNLTTNALYNQMVSPLANMGFSSML